MRPALFEAWQGRHADSPRAVSRRLAEVRPDLTRSWVSDGRSSFPPGTRTIRRHSAQHFARLATSSLLVCNDIVSRHLVDLSWTTRVQCWHGTPLKAIGYDETTPKYDAAAHLRRVERDVRTWDFLLSSSPFCTTVFRRAFGYEGRVLETGLPRNDLLLAEDAHAIRAHVRRSLGIGDHVTAVLYAPTWRDDAKDDEGRFFQPSMPDFDRLTAALGERFVVLRRLHKNVRSDRLPASRSVIDVSAYADVVELILASDVLVSDYSSVIYDYAVTRRPIVCHAPDLEHYVNELRPLYFDYHDWAPGTVTVDDDELVEALRPLVPGQVVDSARYAQFRRTFCPWDDGHATERVVEAFLPALG